jgi:hypothetical protein
MLQLPFRVPALVGAVWPLENLAKYKEEEH